MATAVARGLRPRGPDLIHPARNRPYAPRMKPRHWAYLAGIAACILGATAGWGDKPTLMTVAGTLLIVAIIHEAVATTSGS